MNMNENPTWEQLKDLLGKCNDDNGPHILWINRSGKVQISALCGGSTSAWSRRKKKNILFQHLSIERGKGFVGPDAAADKSLVTDMFDNLLVYWKRASDGISFGPAANASKTIGEQGSQRND